MSGGRPHQYSLPMPGRVAEGRVGRLRRSRGVRALLGSGRALVGAAVLLVVVILAAFPSLFVFHDSSVVDLSRRLQPPAWQSGDWTYPLGADALGRDLWGRIVDGARMSVVLGGLAVVVSGTIGVPLGLLSGYYGGPLDSVISGVSEVQLAFPFILLAITIIATSGPSTVTLIPILALSGWVIFTRIVRGRVLSVREFEFIEAARTIGCTTPRILWKHILPQMVAPIAVVATLEVARMIVLESSLSFLGLGVQAPNVSWGQILSDNR